jgi:uncharacterized protein YjaG (DUF416 family)
VIRAFNRADIADLFRGFTDRQHLAFVAACTERLSDFYWAFCIEADTGDIAAFRRVVDFLWQTCIANGNDQAGAASHRQLLGSLAPDTEAVHMSVFTEQAEYACEVAEMGLDIILGHGTAKGEDAAVVTQTAVEMYLAMANQVYGRGSDASTQEKTSKMSYCELPLFKEELQQQVTDCAILREASDVSEAVIDKLRFHGTVGVAPVRRFRLDASTGREA